jgi:hypothetical protein
MIIKCQLVFVCLISAWSVWRVCGSEQLAHVAGHHNCSQWRSCILLGQPIATLLTAPPSFFFLIVLFYFNVAVNKDTSPTVLCVNENQSQI